MKLKQILSGAALTAALLVSADTIPAKVANPDPGMTGSRSRYVELGAPSYAAPLRAKESSELFGDDTLMEIAAPSDGACGYATRRLYKLRDLPVELEIEAKGKGVVELCVFFCDAKGAIIGKKGCSFTIPDVNRLIFKKFKCDFRIQPPAGTAAIRFGWVVAAGGDMTVKDFEGEYED